MIIPRAEQLLERASEALMPRYTSYCYKNGRYGYYSNCRSSWSRFGRWILVGILILMAIFAVLILLCCVRRRRSRRAPNYGNATPMTAQGPPQNYYGGAPQGQYAPPSGPPPNHGAGGYDYNGQQGGVTQPPNAYYPPK